jgi:Uma2 family endonuclease
VSSRSTRARDRGIKRERYGATGALEVWLVDTHHDVVVIGDRILGASDHITSTHLPGFSLSVGELFNR